MRTFICRFTDEAEFLNHMHRQGGFRFLTEMEMTLGCEVEISVIVASTRQRAQFRAVLVERTKLGIDVGEQGSRTLYSFGATVAADDRVWLQAFASRLATARRVEIAA